MLLGLGLHLSAHHSLTPGGGAPTAPVLSSVTPLGWSGVYDGDLSSGVDPVGNPEFVHVSRSGFDITGQPVTIADRLTITARVREPAPNNANLTASDVSLSDVVYSTDTIVGVANNSTLTSPKPICNWVSLDRDLIGDTLTAELVAFHRDARGGRQVAAVEFYATDGTGTVSQMVALPVVSPATTDRGAVIVYRCNLDVSTLADGVEITLNARVFPHFGDAASIADSADEAERREFSPRFFYRDTALHAEPPIAYVQTDGSNSTGVISSVDTEAYGKPFETVAGVISRYQASGQLDGLRIRIGDGTHLGAVSYGIYSQTGAVVTIERDPRVAQSAAVLSINAAIRPRFPFLRLHDISLLRLGGTMFSGESSRQLEVQFSSLAFDTTASNAALAVNNNTAIYVHGCKTTGLGSSTFNAGPTEVCLLRGFRNVSGSGVLESWLVVGCEFGNCRFSAGTRSQSGSIFAFSKCMSMPTNGGLRFGSDADVDGFALVQSVFEFVSVTTNPSLWISGDNAGGGNTHGVIHANTFPGAFQAGRWNAFYDDGEHRRTSLLLSVKGNIVGAIYTKSDLFRHEVEAGADAALATGNWQFNFGAGCQSNFTLNECNTPLGGNQAQDYPGLLSSIGTSQTVPQDPGWVDNQSTTYDGTYAAGAGGGDYRLADGAAVAGIVSSALLPFDLAGTARPPANDAAGAYAA